MSIDLKKYNLTVDLSKYNTFIDLKKEFPRYKSTLERIFPKSTFAKAHSVKIRKNRAKKVSKIILHNKSAITNLDMNKLEYLLKLKSDPKQIFYTWKSLGGMTVNNNTKMYVKDNLFKVVEHGPMEGAYVFCMYEYIVNPTKGFDSIDWNDVEVDETDGFCFFYQGVESPNFRVILTPEEASKIVFKHPKPDTGSDIGSDIGSDLGSDMGSDIGGESGAVLYDDEVPADFMPFAEKVGDTTAGSNDVIISDNEYQIIMSELGLPFLNEDELVYNKDTIVRMCIRPALDIYYSKFPLVIDEMVGPTSSGHQWKVAYHLFEKNKTAIPYKADAYMTLGTGSSTASAYSTAFSFMRTEMMGMGSMGGGYQWGNGLRYRKAVPGYVGLENSDAALMQMQVRQGYLNQFRREYSRDVIEDNKKYVQGYSSIGGCLNIHWLCIDLDYSHIPSWDVPYVRKLCTAYALRNIGSLINMLKTDENVPFNTESFLSRSKELEDEVISRWDESSLAQSLAINRGGLG